MPEVTTEDQRAGADDASRLTRDAGRPVPPSPRTKPFLIRFYGSAVGKKSVMAVTGIMLLGFVLVHMIGNLKIYLGASHLNEYGEWLRMIGEPALPRTVFLWLLRVGLISAFFFHIQSAYSLTRMNQKARPVKYQSNRMAGP